MPSAQQLLGLIKSHAQGDEDRFVALTVQMAASEERKGHIRLAEQLRSLAEEASRRNSTKAAKGKTVPIVAPRGELAQLVSASYPKTRLSHMILDPETNSGLRRIVKEHWQRWKLQEHGLAPRNKLLLVGPPGSGKTMTASALAGETGLPLFTVLLHGVITKYMGETAAKLRLVFDAIAETKGVYLFDELDALASQRGAGNDVGEARRALNSFLQFLDEDHNDSLLVATTNHPELLDKALFRRFHLIMEYKIPSGTLLIDTIRARLAMFPLDSIEWDLVVEAGAGLSSAEIIRAAEDAARDAVIEDRVAPETSDLLAALRARHTTFRLG
ncbi:AAA family ATPase [Caenispirillum salinarum]|uniref:AAA family ATPase n=1 Tax=Caenispirillum salinarum TaxID=859058 RepID=UPI0005BBFF6F|nr:ATP-binding protein [Caenispirillum salinarum]